MFQKRKATRRVWLGVLVVCSLVVFTGVARGKGKPPKPPPQPLEGVVYYLQAHDGVVHVYSMAPDGANKTLVLIEDWPDPDGINGEVVASGHLHGGERWFLYFMPIGTEVYPDGKQRYELFAVAESGVLVQLSDDATVQPIDTIRYDGQSLQWFAGDTKVSWLARRWGEDGNGNPVVGEAGIFTVDLDRDVADGPTPSAPTKHPIDYPTRTDPDTGHLLPEGSGFHWSLDGTAIVYAGISGLYVADAITGEVIRQLVGESVGSPRWSPTGSLIAFHGNGIDTIAPDGTGRTKIVENSSRRLKWTINDFPRWSPNGGYLVFRRLTTWSGGVKSETWRATSTGDGERNLAEDSHPGNWVHDE